MACAVGRIRETRFREPISLITGTRYQGRCRYCLPFMVQISRFHRFFFLFIVVVVVSPKRLGKFLYDRKVINFRINHNNCVPTRNRKEGHQKKTQKQTSRGHLKSGCANNKRQMFKNVWRHVGRQHISAIVQT